MYAEFYSLGENRGVTFKCCKFDVCGDVYRIQLRPKGESLWFRRDRKTMDFEMCGRTWTDFGVAEKRFRHFKQITQKEAAKWMC